MSSNTKIIKSKYLTPSIIQLDPISIDEFEVIQRAVKKFMMHRTCARELAAERTGSTDTRIKKATIIVSDPESRSTQVVIPKVQALPVGQTVSVLPKVVDPEFALPIIKPIHYSRAGEIYVYHDVSLPLSLPPVYSLKHMKDTFLKENPQYLQTK